MKEIPLNTEATLRDAVNAIEQSRRRITVVLDKDDRPIGTITDGDVRRSLLAGGTMQSMVQNAMNTNPIVAKIDSSDADLLYMMREANILAIPLVDHIGRFKRVVHISDFGNHDQYETSGYAAAVVMAGGEGKRLNPLTKKIPKPMVEVGGIPILERQIRSLVRAGVGQCYIAVNHLSHIIEEHFTDGSNFGLAIEYLREEKKMGTAGALSLLPKVSPGPLLVMNGDLLTTSDFVSLYDYHISHNSIITMAAVEYNVQIPYGVLHTQGELLQKLEEKPSQCYYCNAGIYVLEQELLEQIPSRRYDMTDLIRDCLSTEDSVSVFPVHEYWSDIGTVAELDKTRLLFK